MEQKLTPLRKDYRLLSGFYPGRLELLEVLQNITTSRPSEGSVKVDDLQEKKFALGLGVFIAGWALFAAVVKPAAQRIQTLNRVIPEKQTQLMELRAKTSQYLMLHSRLEALQTTMSSRDRDFKLLTFLESLIAECGLPEKAVKMRQYATQPDSEHYETIVELTLEGLTLEQLVGLLSRVDSNQLPAGVRNLHITKNPTGTGLLDSVVEIHNTHLAENQVTGT